MSRRPGPHGGGKDAGRLAEGVGVAAPAARVRRLLLPQAAPCIHTNETTLDQLAARPPRAFSGDVSSPWRRRGGPRPSADSEEPELHSFGRPGGGAWREPSAWRPAQVGPARLPRLAYGPPSAGPHQTPGGGRATRTPTARIAPAAPRRGGLPRLGGRGVWGPTLQPAASASRSLPRSPGF